MKNKNQIGIGDRIRIKDFPNLTGTILEDIDDELVLVGYDHGKGGGGNSIEQKSELERINL